MLGRVLTTLRQLVVVTLCAAGVEAGCWGAVATAAPSTAPMPAVAPVPIPAQYQNEYDALKAELQSFGTLASSPPGRSKTGGTRARTTMGTELLAANGNIGTGLLKPTAMRGVDAELEAFASLGVEGVTVDVSFPLLLSSTTDHAGYLAFYEHVARGVRAHHMVLSVEENPIFSGTPLTQLHVDYRGLTLVSSAAQQHTEAQTIIDELRPAYLSVLTEPDIYKDAVGVNVDTPSHAVSWVKQVLAGLHRHGTRVGAGTGNWSSPAIDRALLSKTGIDYLDVHAYLFGPAARSNLTQAVSAAKSAHKPLVMDETWFDKPTATEGSGPQGAPEELKVKSYSFWEPLDEQFVTAMAQYARGEGFRYVSFFDGSRAFFAYLPWSQALESAGYAGFSLQYNHAVAVNMAAGVLSGTGQAFRRAQQAQQAG